MSEIAGVDIGGGHNDGVRRRGNVVRRRRRRFHRVELSSSLTVL